MKSIALWLLLSALPLALPAQTPNDANSAAAEQLRLLRQNQDAFDQVPVSTPGSPTIFEVEQEQPIFRTSDGVPINGIRFRVPETPGQDMVWVFTVPKAWANWYLVPAEGPLEQVGGPLYRMDRIYHGLEWDLQKDQAGLQVILADGLVPGRTYLARFRRTSAGPAFRISGVIAFASTPEEGWNLDRIEETLGLESGSPEDQVAFIGSRGGKILLQEDYFEKANADRLINHLIAAIRQLSNTGAVAESMWLTVPVQTNLTLSRLREIAGEPDLEISGANLSKYSQITPWQKPSFADEKLLMFDLFTFHADQDDPEQRIQRVTVSPVNFSGSVAPEGDTIKMVPFTKLLRFYRDGEKVGIMAWMDVSHLELTESAPPSGEYRLMDREGSVREVWASTEPGDWMWRRYHGNGNLAAWGFLEDYRVTDQLFLYRQDGTPLSIMPFEEGKRHGVGVVFDEEGELLAQQRYEAGELVGQARVTPSESDDPNAETVNQNAD